MNDVYRCIGDGVDWITCSLGFYFAPYRDLFFYLLVYTELVDVLYLEG